MIGGNSCAKEKIAVQNRNMEKYFLNIVYLLKIYVNILFQKILNKKSTIFYNRALIL
jgi:hypothetical protein